MIVVLLACSAAVGWWYVMVPRGRDPRFASRANLGELRTRSFTGRLVLGAWATSSWRATRTLLACPNNGSLLILGPTQSGKTSSLVIPALLRWEGPILAASVKDDLVHATASWRSRCGPVGVLDPDVNHPGISARFEPVRLAVSLSAAHAVALSLCAANSDGLPGTDAAFWSQLAAKFLAPMLRAAFLEGGDINLVNSWVNRREVAECEAILFNASELEALEWLGASLDRDERQLGSVYATVEATLAPLLHRDVQIEDLDIARMLREDGTIYLCAAAHEQRRHRALFTSVVEQVLEQAFTLAREQGGSLERKLLVVLDEAAAVAPLRELDVVAATCASHGITLVTCFQDLAQIRARYGETSATVVNNHTTRAVLSGLADPGAAELLGSLLGAASRPQGLFGGRAPQGTRERRLLLEAHELRRLRAHSAVVVSGRLNPVRVALKPYWKQRDLRRQGSVVSADYDPRRGSRRRTSPRSCSESFHLLR